MVDRAYCFYNFTASAKYKRLHEFREGLAECDIPIKCCMHSNIVVGDCFDSESSASKNKRRTVTWIKS